MKTSRENNKNKKKTKLKPKTKDEKKISPENGLKKEIWGRPGEEFSSHPHFRKQEVFFGLKI